MNFVIFHHWPNQCLNKQLLDSIPFPPVEKSNCQNYNEEENKRYPHRQVSLLREWIFLYQLNIVGIVPRDLPLSVESRWHCSSWSYFLLNGSHNKCQPMYSSSRRDLGFGRWIWLCMLHYGQLGISFFVTWWILSFYLNSLHTFPQHDDRAIFFNLSYVISPITA